MDNNHTQKTSSLRALAGGAAILRRRAPSRWDCRGAKLLAMTSLLATSLEAVEVGEALQDPTLEARAVALSAQVKCPVCVGQSIDASGAPLARELRLFVRERVLAGDNDGAIFEALRGRFGEAVLFQPPMTHATLILWGLPLVLLIVAFSVFGWFRRRR